MTVIMDGNVAYVRYITDGENEWEGREKKDFMPDSVLKMDPVMLTMEDVTCLL